VVGEAEEQQTMMTMMIAVEEEDTKGMTVREYEIG
jgi:hypothetical protein